MIWATHVLVSTSMNVLLHLSRLLTGQERMDANTALSVLGWGARQEGGSNTDHLQIVQVYLMDQQTCNTTYSGRVSRSGQICAGEMASCNAVQLVASCLIGRLSRLTHTPIRTFPCLCRASAGGCRCLPG